MDEARLKMNPAKTEFIYFGNTRQIQKCEISSINVATNTSLEKCLLNVKKWMDEARLKMNPAKTEFIYFGNTRQIQKCEISSINVSSDLILTCIAHHCRMLYQRTYN